MHLPDERFAFYSILTTGRMLVKYQLMSKQIIVDCLTQEIATGVLQDCLEDGNIIQGRHFRNELAAESLTIADALFVLRSGSIKDPPEIDIRSREWKYKVEGFEPAGKWLVIAFSFKQIDTVFLITIFSVESRGRES
jgi:hypothetical protein